MFVFTDPRVIQSLCRVVNAYSKIGEHINIHATPSALQLSVLNSSRTVQGRVEFPSDLFSGPGTTKNCCIKAKAADTVLRRLDSEEPANVRWLFVTTRGGLEQLEITLTFAASSALKTLRIPCMAATAYTQDIGGVYGGSSTGYTFECFPSMLKTALSPCENAADEIKVSFQSSLINLFAKRRAKPVGGRGISGSASGGGTPSGAGAGVSNARTAVGGGLKTIINLQPEMFSQITVQTPRQLEFKLREFRTVLAFLSEEVPMQARFGGRTPATNLEVRSEGGVLPISYVFKFVARMSMRSNEVESWLRVGPQERPNGRRLKRSAVSMGSSMSRISTATTSSGVSAISASTMGANAIEAEPARERPVVEEESNEVGFTQGRPDSVRGLFD